MINSVSIYKSNRPQVSFSGQKANKAVKYGFYGIVTLTKGLVGAAQNSENRWLGAVNGVCVGDLIEAATIGTFCYVKAIVQEIRGYAPNVVEVETKIKRLIHNNPFPTIGKLVFPKP